MNPFFVLTLSRRIIPNGLLILLVAVEAVPVALDVSSVVVEAADADVDGRSTGCCFAIASLLVFPGSGGDCLMEGEHAIIVG